MAEPTPTYFNRAGCFKVLSKVQYIDYSAFSQQALTSIPTREDQLELVEEPPVSETIRCWRCELPLKSIIYEVEVTSDGYCEADVVINGLLVDSLPCRMSRMSSVPTKCLARWKPDFPFPMFTITEVGSARLDIRYSGEDTPRVAVKYSFFADDFCVRRGKYQYWTKCPFNIEEGLVYVK